MAIYHFEAKVITRGTGRSVVAASAYASCSQIYNDYDGIMHDYTRKQGCVYSEIFLPPNAPIEWKDRAELWNAVEAAEKSKDSRLARELIVALPIEVGLDEWKSILKNFISEQCISNGMCADLSIHDTDGHNPHAHILLTVRPLDENGKWQAKTQKEYLCKRGDEERGFTAAEFKTAQADDWEKQYQYKVGKKKVYLTPSEAERSGYERVSKNPKSTRFGRQNPICAEWNSEEQILTFRKAWEEAVNKSLEQKNIGARVDCRSFADRGIDEQPTIHEGVTARVMEKCGFVSDRCELNRQIRKDNILLRQLKALVKSLTEAAKEAVSVIAEKLEKCRERAIFSLYEFKHNEKLSADIQRNNTVTDLLLSRFNNVKKQISQKNSKAKKLQVEKNGLNVVNVFKRRQLSAQIENLQTEVAELKTEKAVLLSDMKCENEKDVQNIKKQRKQNDVSLKNISARNAQLAEQMKADISDFKVTIADISPEDMPAVQEERSNFRNTMKSLWTKIQQKYDYRSNYDLLKAAKDEIDMELGEYHPHIRKSIRKDLEQKRQQATERQTQRKRRDEWER